MAVVIETTLGDITVDLYLDQRPVTCLNFLKLCKMKYYNFNLFHTIRSGFIAQTGDPTGEGSGGQSIFGLLEGPEKRFFSGERMPKIRHTNAGLLSMVCTDDMMVGSQFFFTLATDLDSLDGVHCVIGEVAEGHEVLRKLNEVICDESHRPYQDVRITHTVILDDPFNDPAGFRAPSRSPSPSAERLKGGRIAPDEEIDESQGKSAEEIQEIIEEKEAKARATILEIVGDLPDADIAPPENVLFVCKLNPVTTDEDLEIIFSRFGKIVSSEVIRDKKTGDSLQYAFIEFSDKKSCEDAYFKMDNVLIDDRRIHVDFSQSVSKMRWLGKGRGVQHFDHDGNIKGNHFQNKSRNNNNRDDTDRDKYSHRHKGESENLRNNKHESDKYKKKEDREKQVREKKERDSNSKKRYESDRQLRGRSKSEEKHDRRRNQHAEKHLRARSKSRSTVKSISKNDNLKESSRNHRNNDSERISTKNEKYENKKLNKSDKNYSDRKRVDKSESLTRRNNNDKERKNSGSEKRDNKDNKHDSNSSTRKHDSNCSTKKRHRSNSRDDMKSKKSKRHLENVESDRNNERLGREHNKHAAPRTPTPTKEKKVKNDRTKKQVEKNKKKVKKVRNDKKKRKPSTSSSDTDTSDSSTSSSESSSSSSESDRKKRRTRRKKKHSSSSSSESTSSSSSSDSSSSTSSSSDSERDRKKAKISKKKVVQKSKKKP